MSERTAPNRTHHVRNRVAVAFGLVCTVIAVLLVLAAVLVAVRGSINEDNVLVELVKGTANVFDGPFSRDNGIFDFDGKSGETYDALVNWGIAAAAWLAIGRIGSAVIRP